MLLSPIRPSSSSAGRPIAPTCALSRCWTMVTSAFSFTPPLPTDAPMFAMMLVLPPPTLHGFGEGGESGPRRNLQPALDRRPGQAALQPGGDVAEAVKVDDLACLVEGDEVAHPAQGRDVG